MNTSRTYTIRQLTKEFNVTARTLRFYEDEGLIAPARRGQTRIYSGRDRARIILILRGRRVGFSLAEIRGILDLYGVHDGGRSSSKQPSNSRRDDGSSESHAEQSSELRCQMRETRVRSLNRRLLLRIPIAQLWDGSRGADGRARHVSGRNRRFGASAD